LRKHLRKIKGSTILLLDTEEKSFLPVVMLKIEKTSTLLQSVSELQLKKWTLNSRVKE